MKKFNVRVVEVETQLVKVPVTWPDGHVTEKPVEQLFARCTAAGKNVHMVPLMPEDDVPAVGARMKLCVPTAADGPGARPLLMERL